MGGPKGVCEIAVVRVPNGWRQPVIQNVRADRAAGARLITERQGVLGGLLVACLDQAIGGIAWTSSAVRPD